MEAVSTGKPTCRLAAKSFSHYCDYLSAWGQFQLIAIDRDRQVIGP
jgi:hypothetical protein